MHRALPATVLGLISLLTAAAAAEYPSHPPMRPLPQPSATPLADGPRGYVDATRGDDANPGTQDQPWRTIARALRDAKPGLTILLRGGTYYENVALTTQATSEHPLTIRSHPGELAIIDGGYREFFAETESAWEPAPGGVSGEYRSTRTYPELAADPDPNRPVWGSGAFSEQVKVLGNFGDSLVPLQGYHSRRDLQSSNPYWNLKGGKLDEDSHIYCGPGLWFDPETHRIHARLATIPLDALGDDNYRGETNPRKLPLVIGGAGVPLAIDGAQSLRIVDLVVRGTRSHTVSITNSRNIAFDGVVVYGGCPAFYVRGTDGLTLTHTALRGVSAPWSFRSSHKYRGISPYVFIADSTLPQNGHFEIAYCEITDGHDGAIIGTIDGLKFHHNLVDNFNDDGLYLTIWGHAGRDIEISQNRISRCLQVLSFAGEGTGQEGTDVEFCRNLVDLRQPIYKSQPTGPDDSNPIGLAGTTCNDHGSPIWKPMRIYHNTFLLPEATWRGYYGAGFVRAVKNSRRRVFNNIFVHLTGLPDMNFLGIDGDFAADGNLHWSLAEGRSYSGDFLADKRKPRPRQLDWFQMSQSTYPGGWTAHDLFADPQFEQVDATWQRPADVRLRASSPAINAGVPIPDDWADPLRDHDAATPDIGAIPAQTPFWGVGVRGRVPVSGP